MGEQLKPIGRAVAIGKGHYPLVDGRHRVIKPGEVFTLFEGRTKGKWFEALPEGKPAPKPAAQAPAPVDSDTLAGVAAAENKRRTKAPMADPAGLEGKKPERPPCAGVCSRGIEWHLIRTSVTSP